MKHRTASRRDFAAIRKRYLAPLGFGEILILDATERLLLIPSPADVKNAQGHKKDPCECVLAQTLKRQWSAMFGMVQNHYAFVVLPNEEGELICYRYVVDSGTREAIKAWDRGRPFEIGRAFILKVPTGDHRIETRKLNTRDRRKRFPKRHELYSLRQKRATVQRELTQATARLETAQENLEKCRRTEKPQSVRFQTAGQRTREARQAVQGLRDKIDALQAEERAAERAANQAAEATGLADKPIRPYNSVRFDLTTRNGVVGNYQFAI